jgi:hypothetical protein
MRRQYDYRVVLTVKHADGSFSRTKSVTVRASSEERAVNALVEAIEREKSKAVDEIVFQQVS